MRQQIAELQPLSVPGLYGLIVEARHELVRIRPWSRYVVLAVLFGEQEMHLER